MKKFTLNLLFIGLTLFAFDKVNAQDIVDLTGIDNANILVDTLPDVNSGAIVLLEPGMEYNAGGYAFDKSVTLQSSDLTSLVMPKINCASNFNFGDAATVDSIIFRNIEFFGEYDARYVLNSNVAATIGKLMFDGCHIHDLRGILRMKDVGPGTLDSYVINNSVVNMIRDYGIMTVDRDDWACNHIEFTNSTFSKIRAFITSRNNTSTVLIDGCTLNEYTATDQRMFRWRTAGQDNVTEGITIKNTLWGTGWDETGVGNTGIDGYDGLGSTTWTFENVYLMSDFDIADGKDSIMGFDSVYAGTSYDLWADLTEDNFNYADTTFTGIGNAGDQRWAIATEDGGVEFNISAAAFKALGTIDTTSTIAGLTVHASSAKTVVVDANNKTVDGMDFTDRLKLGGSGSFDGDGQPLERVLSIDVTHSSMITVAAMSSSGSADRVLNIAFGHQDSILAEFPALGASLTKADYSYMGGPTKMYFYSPSSGVNIYYIKVVDIANTDASLSDLSVDAGPLDPEFMPGTTAYTCGVPYGTTSVTVSATPTDPNATVTGTGDVDVSSGTAQVTVTVTAEDGTTTMDYVIDITVLPNNDASLSDLTVSEGTLNPVFHTDSLSYTVAFPQGTTTVTVGATPTDPNASVAGTGDIDVSAGSGTIDVVVTAEDGTTSMTYSIEYTVSTGIEDAKLSSMFVYPTVSKGVFNVEFTGKPGVITVYNIAGTMVLKHHASSSVETIRIEREGIYLFRLESENETRTVKVVSIK